MSANHFCTKAYETSLLLKSFAFPGIISNDVHVGRFHGCPIPDFGLGEVDLDASLMEEGVPNLPEGLSQDRTVDVVTQGIVRERRADPVRTMQA